MSSLPRDDFLTQMARSSRERVARAQLQLATPELLARARATPLPPGLRLSGLGFDLIAEVKLRSPASGPLQRGSANVAARVRAYADAGAVAISVLTEPERFGGELAHLAQAAQRLGTTAPVMRKDFLVDVYQVYEARAAGAAGVLVIVRMLPLSRQQQLLEACAQLGLFALLEAFDERDIDNANSLIERYGQHASLLLGVNCRDLSTLQVVPGRLEALAARLPKGVPRVAESGVQEGADVARLVKAGYDVALVGSALMRSGEPAALVGELLATGRAAAACAGSSCG